MEIVSFLFPITCALYNRIRGGWHGYEITKMFPWWNRRTANIFLCLIITLPVYASHSFFESFCFFCLLYIGFLFNFQPWVQMKNPGHDIVCLVLRGLIITFFAGFFLHLYHFAFSGALMGTCYYISYKLPLKHKEQDGHLWGVPEMGELLFGYILGFFSLYDCLSLHP